MAKPKTIAPLDYYQDQFNKSWMQLYQKNADNIEPSFLRFYDSLAQLLDEMLYAQKKQAKKDKKTKKKSKK